MKLEHFHGSPVVKTALSKQGEHAGLIPGRGTNIPHAVSHGQKIRVGKKRKEREGSAQ